MSYSDVLSQNYAGKGWAISDDDYDTLVWNDASPKPTRAQLDAQVAQVESKRRRAAVEELRRVAYRDEADPLFFYWQAGKGTKGAWEAKRAEIDKRYPY